MMVLADDKTDIEELGAGSIRDFFILFLMNIDNPFSDKIAECSAEEATRYPVFVLIDP